MRLTRVFIDTPLAGQSRVMLPEDGGNHLVRVLRLAVGAPLRVFDGHGGEYDATLTLIGKRNVQVELGAHHAIERESPLQVTLLQGLSRGERMDMTLQKATELGVTAIRPVLARRSNVKLDADSTPRKLAHWQAVVTSACEQSGRNRVPQVLSPLDVGAACAATDATLRLMLAIDGARPLPLLLTEAGPVRHIALLVGPEGGLDEAEEAVARRAGFESTLLGRRVLRTETAPLAALAALQTLAGDFGLHQDAVDL
ncbi:MAG: 16S rRNA (uracil(1498)-N(3))-methyltransferase [Proteobacteria bacterium]|nr:16S rRNA (uracil(1498)-N(3))-methyltransferase [Pseudomonadota bacterium]